jgi:hypothetical protein
MKMVLTCANTPAQYVKSWSGWQGAYVRALRHAVIETAPALAESLKWGHLLYSHQGPVLIIRAEPQRVLLGFFRGKRLLHMEPRMTGGGKYELRSLQLMPDTPLEREKLCQLVKQAIQLNTALGSPVDNA